MKLTTQQSIVIHRPLQHRLRGKAAVQRGQRCHLHAHEQKRLARCMRGHFTLRSAPGPHDGHAAAAVIVLASAFPVTLLRYMYLVVPPGPEQRPTYGQTSYMYCTRDFFRPTLCITSQAIGHPIHLEAVKHYYFDGTGRVPLFTAVAPQSRLPLLSRTNVIVHPEKSCTGITSGYRNPRHVTRRPSERSNH